MNTIPAAQSKSVSSMSRTMIVAVLGTVMVVLAVLAGAFVGDLFASETPANAVVIVEAPEGLLGGGVSVSGRGGDTGGLSGTTVGGSGGVTGR